MPRKDIIRWEKAKRFFGCEISRGKSIIHFTDIYLVSVISTTERYSGEQSTLGPRGRGNCLLAKQNTQWCGISTFLCYCLAVKVGKSHKTSDPPSFHCENGAVQINHFKEKMQIPELSSGEPSFNNGIQQVIWSHVKSKSPNNFLYIFKNLWLGQDTEAFYDLIYSLILYWLVEFCLIH